MTISLKLIATEQSPLITPAKKREKRAKGKKMYLFEIANFFQKLKMKNVYVCSSDTLPVKFSLPAGFVCNLSPRNSEGSHWISFIITENRNCLFLDSIFQTPKVENIFRFIKLHSKSLQCCSFQLQNHSSVVCGLYACVFVYFALKYRMNMLEFESNFSGNLVLNDLMIRKMFAHICKRF